MCICVLYLFITHVYMHLYDANEEMPVHVYVHLYCIFYSGYFSNDFLSISYTNYHGKPVSIHEVLQLALQFVGSYDNQNDSNLLGPIPKTGTSSDVNITGTCLRQWTTEIESEIAGHIWNTVY